MDFSKQYFLNPEKKLDMGSMQNRFFLKTKDDEMRVKKRFREMYFPTSEQWRSEVIRQAREIFPKVIKRYQ